MTAITCLSTEVINIILSDESISIKDIVNFSSTCKQFYNTISNNNVLWRKKLYQRWPYLKRVYDKQKHKESIYFDEQVKASIKCRNKLWQYMSLMSEKHYYKDELFDIDIQDFDSLFHPDKDAHPMNYYFLVDELMSLLAQSPMNSDCNLTQKYYAKKLLPYLQHYRLRNIWRKFINFPDEQQILEQAVTIVAQWYQPQKHISYSHIRTLLDNIAKQVLECLKREHSAHSIFSTSAEQFSFWEYNNIDDNHWDSEEGRHIIDAICKVLYNELGFSGALREFYETNPNLEYAFIDCVLENKVGNAVTLGVIFHSVARRLGVRCDLVSLPTHFFLCWKPKYNGTNPRDQEFFYIDLLNNGSILSRNDCPKISGATRCPIDYLNAFEKNSPVEVMLRMITYLHVINNNQNSHDRIAEHSFLELKHLIKPDNMDTVEQLGRHYAQHQTDLSGVIITLEKLQDYYKRTKPAEARRAEVVLNKLKNRVNPPMPVNELIPRQRPKEVKFTIGTIITYYDRFGRKYVGVIIGWDEKFRSHIEVDARCKILNSCLLSGISSLSQPFYVVLCEDGRIYYIAENTIKTSTSKWISHNEVGRYFCRFEQTHYVPNKMLARHYPYDKLSHGCNSRDDFSSTS